jgi:plasmid replication initiation protein
VEELNNRNIVTLSNKIIEAKYNLTLEEQNILYISASQISKGDDEFKEYRIRITDLENIESSVKKHSQIKNVAEKMMSRTITVFDKDNPNDFVVYNLFEKIRYISKEASIVTKFHKELHPFFLQLKNEFTKANINHLVRFKSKYTSRLYLDLKKEYDKQKKYKKNIYIETNLNDLLMRYEMPKSYYDYYSKFKNIFLLKTVDEINNKTDMYVQYEEIKKGRKITSLKFCISEKETTHEEQVKEITDAKTLCDFIPVEMSSRATNVLLDDDLGLQNHDLKNIFNKYDIKDVENVCDELSKCWDSPKLKSRQAFFRGRLKSCKTKSENKEEKKFYFDEK